MYKQYELPYAYGELEPNIDAVTMETHYSKHHAAYTKNLNDAAAKAGVGEKEISALLASLNEVQDAGLRQAIRNNGGGYYNHNLYFSTISPKGGGAPQGSLAREVEKEFGSYDALKEKLSQLAAGQFGSGWAWLSANAKGELMVSSSANQDNPLMDGKGFVPILGIDVWEHAYYLKYKNLRADYVSAFWNVIDWKAVLVNYENVCKK